MTLYKNKYRVESVRLKGWDYSSNGFYFITICVKNRECLFGKIVAWEMALNEYGKIVNQCWHDLPNHYDNIKLDAFGIMPNHIHGIMIVDNNDILSASSVETGFKPVSTTTTIPSSPTTTSTPAQMPNKKRHGLFEFVRALKTFSARRINIIRKPPGTPVWQPRFHDHIIRNQNELYKIREYIVKES